MAGAFDGAKLAILHRGRVLSLLRDDRPDIPYPGRWDLPGGGRERGESPETCALRETWEETGLRLDPGALRWRRRYPGRDRTHWFFVAEVPGVAGLRLGAEGQALRWFPVPDFLAREDAIGFMQARLERYWRQRGATVG